MPQLPRNQPRELLFALAAALAIVAAILPRVAGAAWESVVLAGALAAMVMAVTGRTHSDREWMVIAAGQALAVAGGLVRAGAILVDAQEVPLLADVAVIAGFTVVAAGAFLLARPLPGFDRGPLLDTAVVAVAAGALLWAFVGNAVLKDSALTTAERAVGIAFPFVDLLLVAAVLRLTIGPSVGRRDNDALWLLTGSFVVTVAGHVGHVQLVLRPDGEPPTWPTAAMVAGHLLLASSAWHLSDVESIVGSRRVTGRELPSPERLVGLGAVVLVLLITPVFLDPDLYGPRYAVVAGTVVTFGLLSVRLWMMVSLAAELSRAQSEAVFRALGVHASDVILTVRDGVVVDVNEAVRRVLGMDRAEVVGRDPASIVHPDDRERLDRALENAGDDVVPATVRAGKDRYVDVLASDYTADPRIDALVVTLRDVTARVAVEERLRRAALHDPLTGLANRTLAIDRLEHALAQRNDVTKLAVMFVDLDDFKTVNDVLGHEAGDQVLVEVAKRIRYSLRAGDTAARLGGDEFAILLEQLTSIDEARAVGARLRRAVSQPIDLNARPVTVGASIGIAIATAASTATTLMRDADTAMYAAKSQGLGEQVFDPSMRERAVRRLEMARELPRALERGEFFLNYQPIVDLKAGQLSTVEALIRWRHPERGLIPPLDFVPFAEESGFIVELGAWVLEQAGADARRLEAELGWPIRVNVNVSAGQFGVAGLVATVRRVAAQYSLSPSSIGIELTESMLMTDPQAAIRTLNALHELGTTLLIDDFGTGYCSLAYLHRFPVDVLKIDRAFVSELETTPAKGSFVEAIVGLARAQDLKVVAEGVESRIVEAKLAELGVTSAQGWLYGKAAEVEEIISAWKAAGPPPPDTGTRDLTPLVP